MGSKLLGQLRLVAVTSRSIPAEQLYYEDAILQRSFEAALEKYSDYDWAIIFLGEKPSKSNIAIILANTSYSRKIAILKALLDWALAYRFDDPAEGLKLTEDIVSWTETAKEPLLVDIRGRGHVERANFLRILGEAHRAREAFELAERDLFEDGTGDPLEQAAFYELLGTFERDCGNYEFSAECLEKSLKAVRRYSNGPDVQRVLIAASLSHMYNDEFGRADALLDEAIRVPDPDSSLLNAAAVNRVLVLFYSGQIHRAHQVLTRILAGNGIELATMPDRWRARLDWIEGQILRELGYHDEAIRLLRKARDFFMCQGQGFPVAMISVEISLSYSSRQLYAEVLRELTFSLPFCSGQGHMNYHARAALLLLKNTLDEKGIVEASTVRRILDQLRRKSQAPLEGL